MNYTPNTVWWQPGDIVIHDADSKTTDMLMMVNGYDLKTGLCVTNYFNTSRSRDGRQQRKKYLNGIEYLHDPNRFGIEVKNKATA